MKRERLTQRLASSKENQKSNDLKRNLDGFKYDPSKAKVLKKALHNINVSLGTLMAAMKELALLRGSEITPDGMLGGRGFIMSLRDLKSHINDSVRNLSDVTDTLADELTNPQWGLSKAEVKKVKKEKKDVEDQAEIMEETVEEQEDLDDNHQEDDGKNNDQENDKEAEKETSGEIAPDDVVDSSEIESINRYKDMIEGSMMDKTANTLGKNVMANLLKGDK